MLSRVFWEIGCCMTIMSTSAATTVAAAAAVAALFFLLVCTDMSLDVVCTEGSAIRSGGTWKFSLGCAMYLNSLDSTSLRAKKNTQY